MEVGAAVGTRPGICRDGGTCAVSMAAHTKDIGFMVPGLVWGGERGTARVSGKEAAADRLNQKSLEAL